MPTPNRRTAPPRPSGTCSKATAGHSPTQASGESRQARSPPASSRSHASRAPCAGPRTQRRRRRRDRGGRSISGGSVPALRASPRRSPQRCWRFPPSGSATQGRAARVASPSRPEGSFRRAVAVSGNQGNGNRSGLKDSVRCRTGKGARPGVGPGSRAGSGRDCQPLRPDPAWLKSDRRSASAGPHRPSVCASCRAGVGDGPPLGRTSGRLTVESQCCRPDPTARPRCSRSGGRRRRVGARAAR